MGSVEEKPYHFYRQSTIITGTWLQLGCSFCQNWSLAMGKAEQSGTLLSPDRVLEIIQASGKHFREAPGVAFTYNEPTVWFEFVYDTARLLRRHGYISALISNGFIEPGALEEILPYIDAFNLDLKGFSNAFYRKHCRGELEPVLKVMAMVAGRCHLEVTCLIIPSLNDSPRELNEMFAWLASLSPDLPVHITRYFPSHQLTIPPPPLKPWSGYGKRP